MSFVSAAMVAAMAFAAPPRLGTQVSPALGPTVQGTIAWASANGEYLRLKDGTQLIVPQNDAAPRKKTLTAKLFRSPPRSQRETTK